MTSLAFFNSKGFNGQNSERILKHHAVIRRPDLVFQQHMLLPVFAINLKKEKKRRNSLAWNSNILI